MSERPPATEGFDALPWKQREAIRQALSKGRAVSDPTLADAAIAQAEETQSRLRQVFVVALVVVVTAAAAAIVAYGVISDDPKGIDSLLFGLAVSIGVGALVVWAIALHPLQRARQANLQLAGRTQITTPKRDVSNWIFAWLTSIPIGWALGALLTATGQELPRAVAFVLWLALLWVLKRGFDARDRSDA